MRGTIRPRGQGRWQVQIYVGKVGGKHRRKARTVHGTKADAERLLTRMLVEADTQRRPSGDDLTVAELLERWHATRSPSWSPRTALVARGIIDHHLAPHLGPVKLWKLTPADIDDLYVELGKTLAPRTVVKVHRTLHAALRQAKRWRLILDNPASDARPPATPRQERRVYDPTRLRGLLEWAEAHQVDLAVFVRLAAITGARRGELAALRWPDVDLDGQVVTIQRALTEGAEGWTVVPPKTADSVRRVAVDAHTVALLAAWWTEVDRRRQAFGLDPDPGGWLFPAPLEPDEAMHPASWSNRWRRARDQHGLDGVRLHDLRHGVPTLLLPRGHDIRTLSGRLGHARSSTTLDVYSHVVTEADRAAADDMARVIDDAG